LKLTTDEQKKHHAASLQQQSYLYLIHLTVKLRLHLNGYKWIQVVSSCIHLYIKTAVQRTIIQQYDEAKRVA